MIATVPLAVAAWFARNGVKLVALPFDPGSFEVNQHWHRRYHRDARHRWLRQQVAMLFNDETDDWRELATSSTPKNGQSTEIHQRVMCRHTSRAAAIGGKIAVAYRIAMNGFRNWSLGVHLQVTGSSSFSQSEGTALSMTGSPSAAGP